MQEILTVTVLEHGLGQFLQLGSRNPTLFIGNLLEAGYFQALALLNDLNERRSLGQRVVGAGVEPGKASLQRLNLQFLLGKMYLQGEIIGQNSNLAFKYLSAAAENENVGAMYFLGKELLLGEKLPKNVSDGFDWLVKAMDSGNLYAKFLLAKEYLSGENIPRYPDIAVQLLEELSADNFEYAEYLLGKLYYRY